MGGVGGGVPFAKTAEKKTAASTKWAHPCMNGGVGALSNEQIESKCSLWA